MEKDVKATIRRVHCPEGTVVPILRTQKEDLIRAKNFSQTHLANVHPDTVEKPGEHIVALTPLAKTTYYGVSGRLNVYSLQLNKDQQSTVQMWIENGTPEKYASLQAGWMLFFVNLNQHIMLDSTVGGKDVGYWPKAIIPQLSDNASLVAWGGMATGPPDGDSPPMGNGHYPDGDFMKACFIKQLQTMDAANNFVVPDEDGMNSFVDKQDCYGFEYLGYKLDWWTGREMWNVKCERQCRNC
ncbi:hypothetical protein FRX31_029037 [Thalictrum thalictroides]|uniref:Neprosin PEP catalytic domain-containing protein n=1 Tax=Thalictrum thalictroides TaxID=46969 RepID=A0A7J6VAI2_THATH|nr:hypothetical protein FRX31_029037 [Thalictrum thalictroides]